MALKAVGGPLKILYGVLWLILLVASARAQQPVTLSEALALAEARHPAVVNGQLAVEASERARRAAYGPGYTSVFLQRGQFNTDAVDNFWSVDQSFDNPLAWGAEARAARYQTRVARVQLDRRRHALQKQVSLAYHDWQHAHRSYVLLRSFQDEYARFVMVARRGDDTTALDAVAAEAEWAQLRVRQRSLLAARRAARYRFNVAVYADGYVPIAEPPARVPLRALPNSLPATVPGSAALRLLDAEAALAKQAVRVQAADFGPQVQAGVFRVEIDGVTGFQGFQVGVSLPLWFAPATYRLQASRLRAQIAANRTAYERFRLGQEVAERTTLLGEHDYSLRYYENAGLAQADTLVGRSGRRYRQGDIPYYEHLRHLAEALRVRTDYLDALHAYNTAVIELNYLLAP